jgi:DNA-binding transcriptional LysR family regulator
MPRENLNDVLAFLAVAQAKSFTKAAAQLGVSQSALSHTIRSLESRIGVRLLTRTTRSVAPTQAGERLLTAVGPRFEEIRAELAALSELRDKPTGMVRITAGLHATETILWPKLQPILKKHPDIHVEITVDYGLTNIVADRFDAGVRLGEQVAKDMIAVRIGPDFRMAVVAAPAYFSNRAEPRTPQELTGHNCINLRLLRRRLLAGRHCGSARRTGTAAVSTGTVVRTVLWISRVLPKPSPSSSGLDSSRGCAALPALRGRIKAAAVVACSN